MNVPPLARWLLRVLMPQTLLGKAVMYAVSITTGLTFGWFFTADGGLNGWLVWPLVLAIVLDFTLVPWLNRVAERRVAQLQATSRA